MSNSTIAWGDGVNPHPAQVHQGPARQAAMVVQSTDNHPASTVQIEGASNGLSRSNIRPSLAAARSASDRDLRRRRSQTGLVRGLELSSESARDRAVDRNFPEINFAELQDNLSRVQIPQGGALLTVMPKLSSSEHLLVKSRVPAHKQHKIVNKDLLFINKYKDPRPLDFRRDPDLEESSSPEKGRDSIPSPPVSESPPPQNPSDDGQDAFSVCRRAYEASISNAPVWYPGRRFYGEAEARAE